MNHITKLFAVLVSCVLLLSVSSVYSASGVRSMQAQRIKIKPQAPKIECRLDDAIWQLSPVSSDFQQLDPIEGEVASEKTTVQVAYDEEGLYVGIRCYDSDPQVIVSRLTRRDGETEADWGLAQPRYASPPPDRLFFYGLRVGLGYRRDLCRRPQKGRDLECGVGGGDFDRCRGVERRFLLPLVM